MNAWSRALLTLLGASILVATIFCIPLFYRGSRSLGAIENIHGIPFPKTDEGTVVTEKLAHADIFLAEPVLAKNVRLAITFNPGNSTKLSVGIRENDFWLSYPKVELYEATSNAQPVTQTKIISIPLTDKLQDKDRSIDLMFFAENSASSAAVDEGIHDQTSWQLVSLEAEVLPTLPTKPEFKDYVKSILKKERPL